MASVKEIKLEIKQSFKKKGPVLRPFSVDKNENNNDEETENNNKTVKTNVSKMIEARNEESKNIIQNETTEKKISNLEREKLQNIDLRKQLNAKLKLFDKNKLKLKSSDTTKPDAEKTTSGKMTHDDKEIKAVSENGNSSVKDKINETEMEQQTAIDFGTEKPSPSDSLSSSIRSSKASSSGNGPVFEPGNMLDELQKYLNKKFGPIMASSTASVQVTGVEEAKADSAKADIENSDTPSIIDASSGLNGAKDDSNTENSDKVHVRDVKAPDRKSEGFIPHPLFFKTSIKKDPGSKLHDALVQELSTVLKKRDHPSKEPEKVESKDTEKDGVKFPKRRISAKGNNVFGNKALMATLENHLTRTLLSGL